MEKSPDLGRFGDGTYVRGRTESRRYEGRCAAGDHVRHALASSSAGVGQSGRSRPPARRRQVRISRPVVLTTVVAVAAVAVATAVAATPTSGTWTSTGEGGAFFTVSGSKILPAG